MILKELNEQFTSLIAPQLILCLLTLSSEFLSMSLANFLDLTARLRNLLSDQSLSLSGWKNNVIAGSFSSIKQRSSTAHLPLIVDYPKIQVDLDLKLFSGLSFLESSQA